MSPRVLKQEPKGDRSLNYIERDRENLFHDSNRARCEQSSWDNAPRQSFDASLPAPQSNMWYQLVYTWTVSGYLTLRDLFTMAYELDNKAFQFIHGFVFVPLCAALISTFTSCGCCVKNTIPSLFRWGNLIFVAIWHRTWFSRWVHTSLTKYIPNVIGTLYSIINYQPVLISIPISLTLYQPTQVFVRDHFDALKSNPWWLTFLFLVWWKAIKVVVHTYSYVFLTEANLYRPAINPTFLPKDGSFPVSSPNQTA